MFMLLFIYLFVYFNANTPTNKKILMTYSRHRSINVAVQQWTYMKEHERFQTI